MTIEYQKHGRGPDGRGRGNGDLKFTMLSNHCEEAEIGPLQGTLATLALDWTIVIPNSVTQAAWLRISKYGGQRGSRGKVFVCCCWSFEYLVLPIRCKIILWAKLGKFGTIILRTWVALRGYCTPDQFCDCYGFFLKNYNILETSKICFV